MPHAPAALAHLPLWFTRAWSRCALALKGCDWRRAGRTHRTTRLPTDFWTINLLVAGRMLLVDGGSTREATAPAAWMRPPHRRLREEGGSGELRWWTAHFTVACAPAVANPLASLALPAVLAVDDLAAWRADIDLVSAACPQWAPASAAQGLWARGALERLVLRHLGAGFAGGGLSGGAPSAAPAWLRDLHLWLRTSVPRRRLTVAEVVARSGFSHAHVAATVRRCFGSTVSGLLRDERLIVATQLLRERPDQTVGEIAARLHYPSTALFCRHFRAALGCSPGRWRRDAGAASGGMDKKA